MGTPDSELYEKWLKFVFDRPVTRPQWFFQIDHDPFAATEDQLVDLIGETFRRSGTDLLPFSDAQVDDGLNYILFNAGSNTIFSICQKGVALEKRVDTVLNMKILYRDCYAKRCAPVLSHLDEAGSNALNHTCYMLWDASPLRSWKSVVLDVMQAALYLPNIACAESALHGLGHRAHQDRSAVSEIVDTFIRKSPGLRPELRAYALSAKHGNVQ
jgi:hypothetical protein